MMLLNHSNPIVKSLMTAINYTVPIEVNLTKI